MKIAAKKGIGIRWIYGLRTPKLAPHIKVSMNPKINPKIASTNKMQSFLLVVLDNLLCSSNNR